MENAFNEDHESTNLYTKSLIRMIWIYIKSLGIQKTHKDIYIYIYIEGNKSHKLFRKTKDFPNLVLMLKHFNSGQQMLQHVTYQNKNQNENNLNVDNQFDHYWHKSPLIQNLDRLDFITWTCKLTTQNMMSNNWLLTHIINLHKRKEIFSNDVCLK